MIPIIKIIASWSFSHIYNGTIMFYDDKSIGAGYRPKVFLRKSSVGSRDIPQDVSVRQSLAVLSLVRRRHIHSFRSFFYVESAPKIKSRDSFFIHSTLESRVDFNKISLFITYTYTVNWILNSMKSYLSIYVIYILYALVDYSCIMFLSIVKLSEWKSWTKRGSQICKCKSFLETLEFAD